MKNYNWIEKIDGEQYVTPIIIQNDCDYLPGLKKTLNSFIADLKSSDIDNTIENEIESYSNRVIEVIEQYYKGNIFSAQDTVSELLSSFDSSPAVTLVNDCLAFSPFKDSEKVGVQFFRARLSDNVTTFSAKEMLHIPFNKRGIVKTERFSIPGLPCLYLANTSYGCWVEMGSPADYRFNVSPFELDNTQRILNLTIAFFELKTILFEAEDLDVTLDDKYITDLLKLFVLTLSTSFKVNSTDRTFKSEYILSQLIMLAAKDMGIDGISYLSKQVSNDLLAAVSGVNVVLFATYNGEEEHSKIKDHLTTDNSFNFSMFKQLLPCQKYKTVDLRIDYSPYVNNIGSFDRPIKYQETEFYEFDKYIFGNWKKKKI